MPDELKSAFQDFGTGDWLFVAWSLVLAGFGIRALTRGHALVGEDRPTELNGLTSASLSFFTFGVFFGAVYISAGIYSQVFTQLGGEVGAFAMLAQFLGQLTGVVILLSMGAFVRGAVALAPSATLPGEPAPAPTPAIIDELRSTWKALTFPRWLGAFLCVVGLSVIAALAWKGFYWFCSLQGQKLPDEPQQMVDLLIHWKGPFWQLAVIFLAVTVGAPLVEELAFRGSLYTSFKGWLPRGYAIVATGLVFAIVHGSVLAFLPLFAFGSFLCIVRDRYGLLTCVLVHAAFNAHTFLWLMVAPHASTKF